MNWGSAANAGVTIYVMSSTVSNTAIDFFIQILLLVFSGQVFNFHPIGFSSLLLGRFYHICKILSIVF